MAGIVWSKRLAKLISVALLVAPVSAHRLMFQCDSAAQFGS